MSFATKTEKGKRRANEDNCLAVSCGFGFFIAVADGMGGHSGGAIASGLAISTLTDSSYTTAKIKNCEDYLVDVYTLANKKIFSEALSNPACAGMGTTLVSAIVSGEKYYAANVGDSRLYLYRNGSDSVRPITQDHSYVQELVRSGLITPEEARVHPNRNLITRAVGTSSVVAVDTFSGELYDGDLLLLCSDGLHGVLTNDDILDSILEIHDLGELCDSLIQLALKKGSKDNITIAVYLHDGVVDG